MDLLAYLRKRYPGGKLKASYNHLEYIECLSRDQCLALRQYREDGYVKIEHLVEILQ